jgi:excisionase family DNA binding protein
MSKTQAFRGSCLLTMDAVAERTGVSVRTVRRWIEHGELVAHRLGRAVRISEADLVTFLALRRGVLS